MKKNLILIIAVILAGCETNPPTQPLSLKTGEVKVAISVKEDNTINPDRIILLEDFANVSCIPCVTSNKIIRSVLNNYGSDKIVSVKFPTNFPSPVDPFYLAGKSFCDFRISYYNILFAPTIILDGTMRPTPTDSVALKESINERLAVTSNMSIAVTKTSVNGGLLFNIDIAIKDKSIQDLDELFLKCALVESEIEFEQPPGANGETKFYDVLRLLLPSNEGFVLSSLDGSHTYQFDNSLDSLWNINKIEAVVFIQKADTKEVYQTGSTFK